MSAATYALGRPNPAAERGGDCRARDLTQGRNVHGTHRFAATTDCQISNGLLTLTVGASGAAPSLTVEAMTGYRSTGDVYVDTYADVYPGSYTALEWSAMGTVTIDSSTLTALLTAVRIVRLTPHAVTIRLVSPVTADAFVTLKRGWRMARIQHGSTRAPLVTTNRRVRWTAGWTSSTATAALVQESAPLTNGFARWVSGPVGSTSSAPGFSVIASGATTATFGAGIATTGYRDTVADMVSQLGDAARPRLVVS